MSLLDAQDIRAGYSAADSVLKGVGIEVDRGEIVCIIGPNGAGKSTLLKSLAGLLRISSGHIRFQDREIAGLPARRIAGLGLAFVPQEANVFGTLSVQENLEIGAYLESDRMRSRRDAVWGRFPELAAKRRHAARTLSGGQRQILAMAIALMSAPHLLLLDEPSAGLSPIASARLFATIGEINRDGVAICIVEQNALQALAISHRAYIMVDGRNSRSGPAAALAADPEVRRTFLGR
ncbi:MAG TPA: ABC transporter ATP-binding protein [Candidatus Cybelea sp.]|nr:ABC transporter ATP-binding protein [Candidatus Cybelea sp.]